MELCAFCTVSVAPLHLTRQWENHQRFSVAVAKYISRSLRNQNEKFPKKNLGRYLLSFFQNFFHRAYEWQRNHIIHFGFNGAVRKPPAIFRRRRWTSQPLRTIQLRESGRKVSKRYAQSKVEAWLITDDKIAEITTEMVCIPYQRLGQSVWTHMMNLWGSQQKGWQIGQTSHNLRNTCYYRTFSFWNIKNPSSRLKCRHIIMIR